MTLNGIGALLGGTITRTPECLHPRIAPPRASTKKLTRKLEQEFHIIEKILDKTVNSQKIKQLQENNSDYDSVPEMKH